MSNLLPKGRRRRVRRGRGKAPPSHLLQPPPPQLAPSFVQSHTKDKGPRPAWPSAPSSLKALKETAPPSLPWGCGAGWTGCATGPGLSGTPRATHFSLAPPAPDRESFSPRPGAPRCHVAQNRRRGRGEKGGSQGPAPPLLPQAEGPGKHSSAAPVLGSLTSLRPPRSFVSYCRPPGVPSPPFSPRSSPSAFLREDASACILRAAGLWAATP